MNREIKFRAWDSKNHIMMPYVNILGINEGFAYSRDRSWIHNSMQWDEEDERDFIYNPILMQFTGITDKNGKEIYEGDILAPINHFSKTPFSVKFSHGSFVAHNPNCCKVCELSYGCICNLTEALSYNYGQAEVIGNIYENPDLIK